MVQLIVGASGKGKTKYLLDLATQEIQQVSGTIAYLDKNAKHMYELNNKIRLIDLSSYHLQNSDEFVGFILGLLSQDHDLEEIFLDSFLKLANLEDKDIKETLDRLVAIGEEYGVKFIVSVNLDEKDIPTDTKAEILVSL